MLVELTVSTHTLAQIALAVVVMFASIPFLFFVFSFIAIRLSINGWQLLFIAIAWCLVVFSCTMYILNHPIQLPNFITVNWTP